MGQKMNIKDAAVATGLSLWELRQGVKSGKYPALKIGVGKGKYIFDYEMLEERIRDLMQMNIKKEFESNQDTGSKIRRVV
jgi:hypothetical protein